MPVIDKLHWLGHSSFRWEASKLIYFDPWKLKPGQPKADMIFISHDHFDHLSLPDIAALSDGKTVIVTDRAAAEQIKAAGVTCREVKILIPGEELELDGVKVAGVPSYNHTKPFHPRKDQKLGFIITLDGTSIYHAGDTDHIPEMQNYKCDIALLPVSGTYVMTAEEAAQAALAINPKIAVPMHYGEVAGAPGDAEHFAKLLQGKIEVRIPVKV